jgi:hypothetical protein
MTSRHPPDRVPQPPRDGRGPTRLAAVAVLALALATSGGCAGADGIQGSLGGVRAGQAKAKPLTGGWVAVLTPDQAAAFLAAAGTDQPAPEGLPYLNARVRHEGVTDAGGALAPVDDQGRFTTTARGAQVLCVLREVPNQPDVLRGCASLTLPERGTLALTLRADRLDATLDG